MIKLELTFACNPDKVYYPVLGSTLTDTFNEQLDNATMFLDHINNDDRLIDIKPYDYVRIVGKDGMQTIFSKLMLVNSFFEREINIQEHIYSYQISLMSETKWLEKIQCPNLTITHKINKDGSVVKQTIYEYICHYMDLYIPKIKIQREMYVVQANIPYYSPITNSTITFGDTIVENYGQVGTNPLVVNLNLKKYIIDINRYGTRLGYAYFDTQWNIIDNIENIPSNSLFSYQPLITYPSENTEFYAKFNVSSADLGTSSNTLRQVLTTLMQQVSCIPIVKNRVLSFLDFKSPQDNFIIGDDNANEFSYIQRSLSSDSYVNTLVTPASQVLDSENLVISENVGFRDKSNVLIKQTQNLFLETKFPIYKVEKCIAYLPLTTNIKISTSVNSYGLDLSPVIPFFRLKELSTGIFKLSYSRAPNYVNVSGTYNISDVEWDDKEYDDDGVRRFINFNNIKSYNISFVFNNATSFGGEINDFYISSNMKNFIWLDLTITFLPSNTYKNPSRLVVFFDLEKGYEDGYYYPISIERNISYQEENKTKTRKMYYISPLLKIGNDITKLVKENQERNLLSTNFNDFIYMLNHNPNIDDASNYLYGTVGYNIGSKQITGFSTTFSDGDATIAGWITKTYTIIESIFKIFSKNNINSEEILQDLGIPIPLYVDDNLDNTGTLKSDFPMTLNSFLINNIPFSLCTFDIEYQPLNSYNLSYVKKEDIPIPIEQYHSSGDALSDFDRLSASTQQNVDKIGQETINIPQRTTNWSNIKPLNSKFGDYTIFNRRIEINNYHYGVLYTASKNVVLKDYFTSIRTKYRAFANVDYGQSVLRKERDLIYIYIGTKQLQYNELDEKINLHNDEYIKNFFDGMLNKEYDPNKALTYVVESDGQQFVKNDISVITTNNIMAIIYEQPDNVSLGTYFENPKVDTSVGGLVQKWQKWENYDNYNEKHQIVFTNDIIKKDINSTMGSDFYYSLPIYTKNINDKKIFSIVTNRKQDDENRYFYKDNAEIINHTVEFIYYSDSDDVEWTELFIKNNSLVQNSPCFPNSLLFVNENYEFSKEHNANVRYINNIPTNPLNFVETNFEQYFEIQDNKIIIKWNLINKDPILSLFVQENSIVISNYNETSKIAKDFIKFKAPRNLTQPQTYYVAFNDTKTFECFKNINGLLTLK